MILHGLEKIHYPMMDTVGPSRIVPKNSQDINQAHLNIHASKVNVLILLL